MLIGQALWCMLLVSIFLCAVNASSKGVSDPVILSVSNEGGNKSSPLLYGVMFEVSSLILFMGSL